MRAPASARTKGGGRVREKTRARMHKTVLRMPPVCFGAAPTPTSSAVLTMLTMLTVLTQLNDRSGELCALWDAVQLGRGNGSKERRGQLGHSRRRTAAQGDDVGPLHRGCDWRQYYICIGYSDGGGEGKAPGAICCRRQRRWGWRRHLQGSVRTLRFAARCSERAWCSSRCAVQYASATKGRCTVHDSTLRTTFSLHLYLC